MLINLDRSKALDRIDNAFLKTVLSAAGFGLHSRSWIRLLYAFPHRVVMVELNGIRLKPFTLFRSIHQGCQLMLMRYVFEPEPFLRKLRANPVLRGLPLPDSTEVAMYTEYADDVNALVRSSAAVVEVSK